MTIHLRPENCNYDVPALIQEAVESKLRLRIEFPGQIPTVQSKNQIKEELLQLIQAEMKKFKWICFGPVWIELTWFIDAANRQETDVIGDLDNITKPILDSFTGLNGIMVDDSQTKSIYTRWLAKNSAIPQNILEISIEFLNEEVVEKDKAYFIQYSGPMCFIIDLNPHNPKELEIIRLFAGGKLQQRALSEEILMKHAADVRFPLIASQKDFHRTRLGDIPPDRIFRLA